MASQRLCAVLVRAQDFGGAFTRRSCDETRRDRSVSKIRAELIHQARAKPCPCVYAKVAIASVKPVYSLIESQPCVVPRGSRVTTSRQGPLHAKSEHVCPMPAQAPGSPQNSTSKILDPRPEGTRGEGGGDLRKICCSIL